MSFVMSPLELFLILFLLFIFFAPIIAILVWLGTRRKKTSKDAIDLARERYAKGEIPKEEFEEIRHNLVESDSKR